MLTIRRGTINDLTAIMDYSRAAADSSEGYRVLGFNSVIWRRSLKDAMQDTDMVVFIAVREKQVVGLLVGMRSPAPWFAGSVATDLVFSAKAGGDVLLDAFVAWCITKRVNRIDMGVSEKLAEEQLEVYDRMFRRSGFEAAGRVYYRIMEQKK